MIDYLSATLFECKDTPNFGHLQMESKQFSSGWEIFSLQGCEKLKIWWKPQLQMLRLDGSIPYCWQGNDFSCSSADVVEAINDIKGLLHVDLWKASLNAFEYGVIIPTELRPKEYILHHSAKNQEHLTQEEKAKDKGNFRWWSDRNASLKMYDAGRNIKNKQSFNRQKALQSLGWNPDDNFLKWEAHYLKPESLNKGVALHLYDLANPKWQATIKEDLYLQYQRLIPMKNVIIPKDKKDLSTADILALAISEESINQGHPLEDVKKLLYAKINSVPDEVLTIADKKARKRQIKQLLDKIQESPESKWDLSANIQEALEIES